VQSKTEQRIFTYVSFLASDFEPEKRRFVPYKSLDPDFMAATLFGPICHSRKSREDRDSPGGRVINNAALLSPGNSQADSGDGSATCPTGTGCSLVYQHKEQSSASIPW